MSAVDSETPLATQLVEAALLRNAARVELGTHRAITQEHAALEPVEEGTSHGVRILHEQASSKQASRRVQSRRRYSPASNSSASNSSATRGLAALRRPNLSRRSDRIDEGLLIPETGVRTTDVPTGTGAPEHNFWRFTGEQMRRARMAARLQGDLGINLAGVAVALQLLDEIEELRERLEAISTIAHTD